MHQSWSYLVHTKEKHKKKKKVSDIYKKRTNNQLINTQSFGSSGRISTAIAPHPVNWSCKITVKYGTKVYEMEE